MGKEVTVILCTASLLFVTGCDLFKPATASAGSFSITSSSDGSFLLNRDTGEVWHYSQQDNKFIWVGQAGKPNGKSVKLSVAMKLPENKNKSVEEVTKDIESYGYSVDSSDYKPATTRFAVDAPNGKTYIFPDRTKAEGFKKAAHITTEIHEVDE
jgi:hypothetical protein